MRVSFTLLNPMSGSKASPVSHTFKVRAEFSGFSPWMFYSKIPSSLAWIIAVVSWPSSCLSLLQTIIPTAASNLEKQTPDHAIP